MNKLKVLVATPVFDGMAYCIDDFLERILSLSYEDYDVLLVDNSAARDFSKRLSREYGVNVIHLSLGEIPGMKKVVRSRNRIFTYAFENSYDYILMMDSDVIPPVDVIERLLAHRKDVVSGLYFGVFNVDRSQKVEPVAWKCLTEEEWNEVGEKLVSDMVRKREDIRRHLTEEEVGGGELQEVIIASGGCLLVSRNIFSRFRYGLLDVPGKFSTGDDIYFFRKLREAGVGVYCDPSVRCEHLTEGKFVLENGEWVHPLHRSQ